MRYAFRIVNVFTVDGDKFSGNPLCVFERADGLDTEQMQALARQMNLSETTFVLPSTSADARVRIFTPGFEMAFAGHPTLGTASVIADGRTDLRLEMPVGVVEVKGRASSWTLRAAKAPAIRQVLASTTELSRMLGLPDGAIAEEPLWVDTGVEQLVVPIASADLVRAVKPVPELVSRWGYSATRDEAMAYLWARDGATLAVRFFFTSNGALLEDPATGSACANLGGWMIAKGKPLPFQATLSQGQSLGRPSRLGLSVHHDRSIYVTGEAIEVGRGTFDL